MKKTIRKKISDALKGRRFLEEHKQKMSNALRGRKMPEGFGAKISECKRRQWKTHCYDNIHSEEINQKRAEGVKRSWLTRPRHFSEDHKQRIREGLRRFRKNHPDFQKGKNHPCHGRHWNHTEETKEIIRRLRLKQIFPVKDTQIEIKLQNALRERNIPFATHKPVYSVGFACQPDLFIHPNICVFADGDYWHSLPNIIEKDMRQNESLRMLGYQVLRFWEHEINENLDSCLNRIWFTI